MALKNRPARTMASAFFSVALVAGLLPALPAAAYAEDQDASPTIAIQAAQDSSQLEGEEVGTTPATQSLLSQLAFRYSDYEGTQNFDYSTVIDTSEAIPTYTVTVPSTCQALYAAATLAEGVEGEITVSYTDTDGGTKTKTVPSGSAVNLRGALDSYEYATKGNSFDVKVGDQVAAHVVVVRALALSGFTVQDASGVDLTIDPEFQKPRSTRPITYEYAVSAFESNSITVKPVSHVKDATITVNGEALTDGAATITPSFDDQGKATATIVLASDNITTTYTLTINKLTASFGGTGAAEDPYILASAEDLTSLSNLVQQGVTFAGKYFKLSENITLPDGWVPLGAMKPGKTEADPNSYNANKIDGINVFSGSIEGANHTITVPKGGLPLLGFVSGASVSNLKIYGEEIAGYGLVNGYHITGTSAQAIVIDNVTLLSGTKTLKSGFLGGYTSADFTAEIKNSTIEAGVTIGYDKQQSRIGSFAGSFNGTITNCTSNADVYGVDMVGGIAGARGNSMSVGTIDGCTFGGTVTATGTYAGGISGAGYDGLGWGLASAPNAKWSTFTNNTVTGNVTGVSRVGGILGGEGAVYQCWDNGAGSISNNTVTGTVSGETEVGAVIGFLASLDRCTTVENNTYAFTSAEQGIGRVEWVDTSYENPTAVEGTTYLNSGDTSTPLPDFKAGTGRWDPKCFTQRNYQRTDDPLGADAENLTRALPGFVASTSASADQATPVKAGDTVTVDVTITANNGVAALSGTVSYDPADFELVSVAKGAGLSEGTSFLPAENAAEAYFSFYGNTADAKDGIVVATVTLKALKAADASVISITDGVAALVGNAMDYSVEAGTFATLDVIANAQMGDANGNNRVNIVDAQVIYDMGCGKYGEDYAKLAIPETWNRATLLWAANVNSDDAIDAADAFATQHFVHYGTWK